MKTFLTLLILLLYAPGLSSNDYTIVWKRVIDSGNSECAFDPVLDSNRNIHVTGYMYIGPNSDMFTAVYDSAGNLLNTDTLDNGSYDYAMGIAMDSSGNFYITGKSYNGTNYDYLTYKMPLSWIDIIDMGRNDEAWDVAVDKNGYIYVTGHILLDDYWTRYTVKYKPSGDTVWTRKSYLTYDNFATSVAIDSKGNVYVGGSKSTFEGYQYWYITKYDSLGSLLWEDSIPQGYYADAYIYDLAVDKWNNIYATGRTFFPYFSHYQYLTVKWDSMGSIVWLREYGIYEDAFAYGIDVDTMGNVYVTGKISVNDDNEIATIKYDSSGNLVWADTIFHPGDDCGYGICIDKDRNIIYVVGYQDNGSNIDFVTIKYGIFRVSVEPDTININTPTDIMVTTISGDVPEDSIEVSIEGYDVFNVDTTNASGHAYLNGINSPYGQILLVKGRKITSTSYCFQETVWVVNGDNFTSVEVRARSDTINVDGYLMGGIPGVISTYTRPDGHKAFISGCGIDTIVETTTDTMETDVIPLSNGIIDVVIGKSGYNLYNTRVVVKDFKGYVEGIVKDNSTSNGINNVYIRFYQAGADTSTDTPVFSGYSGTDGGFDADSLLCGFYDVYLREVGYIDTVYHIVIQNPYNNYTFEMEPASTCSFTGYVLEAHSLKPLTSTVKIYRVDNGQLFRVTTSDSLAGGVFNITLPFFKYRFLISSFYHTSCDTTMDINTVIKIDTFYLDNTWGYVLLVDDDDYPKKRILPGKRMSKNDIPPLDKRDVKLSESSDKIYRWLVEFGYMVDTINSEQAISADWSPYDVVILSSGNDFNPLSQPGLIDKITAWYNSGGKLLIEGGEVGYDYRGSDFDHTVLHVDRWDVDSAGNLVLQDSSHNLAIRPNILPDTIHIQYSSWYDEDAMTLYSGGALVFGTEKYPSNAGICVHDNTPGPEAGQVVYYAFNLNALTDTIVSKQLLKNSVFYLLTDESPPTATIHGTVDCRGNPDDSGVLVKLESHKTAYIETTYTDIGGNYSFTVCGDTYDLYFRKAEYSDTLITVYVGDSGDVRVDAALYPYIWIYNEDFEQNNGNIVEVGDWEWGIPTSGPGNAHSGSRCWATVLDTDYTNNSYSLMLLTSLDLSGASGQVTLEFYQWFDFENGYDGGNINVTADGINWSIVYPVSPPYNEDSFPSGNACIPGEPGYTGKIEEWTKTIVDLSDYAGDSSVAIKFSFGSDRNLTRSGWYIDDIRVGYADYTVGTSETPEEAKVSLVRNIDIGCVNIECALPRSGLVSIDVYDITGRNVYRKSKVKAPGYYKEKIKIDRSGVYFVKVHVFDKSYMFKVVLL